MGETKSGFVGVVLRDHLRKIVDGKRVKISGPSVLFGEALCFEGSEDKDLTTLSVSELVPPWQFGVIVTRH